MLQGLVLDFDGVVVNSEPLHLRAFQEVLALGGQGLSAQEYLRDMSAWTTRRCSRLTRRTGGSGVSGEWLDDLIQAKTARMQDLLRNGSPLFPGASERIQELSRVVPLAIGRARCVTRS